MCVLWGAKSQTASCEVSSPFCVEPGGGCKRTALTLSMQVLTCESVIYCSETNEKYQQTNFQFIFKSSQVSHSVLIVLLWMFIIIIYMYIIVDIVNIVQLQCIVNCFVTLPKCILKSESQIWCAFEVCNSASLVWRIHIIKATLNLFRCVTWA